VNHGAPKKQRNFSVCRPRYFPILKKLMTQLVHPYDQEEYLEGIEKADAGD